MKLGDGPCGGVEKKLANTLTNEGSSLNVVWEILVPESTGNCTVKLSYGNQDEKSFKTLMPKEGKINEDGSFPCGRNKGFEHQEFILPENYECDGCTLQWKWTTSYGDIYSCSDIIISGGSLKKCLGKCLNGGSCFNGECMCLEGFSGKFCQNTLFSVIIKQDSLIESFTCGGCGIMDMKNINDIVKGYNGQSNIEKPRSIQSVTARYYKELDQYADLMHAKVDLREQRVMLYAEIKVLGWMLGKADNTITQDIDAACKKLG